jgi:hypothetical protein
MQSRILPLLVSAMLLACSARPDTEGQSPGGGNAGSSTTQAGQSSRGGTAPSDRGGPPASHVFSIRFDYRLDTAGYFDPVLHPERRAALEAAAASWSARLTEDFLEVPSDTRLRLNNPEDRDEELWLDVSGQDIDDLLVFVGTSDEIDGYGRGGPASVAESTDATLNQSLLNRVSGRKFEPWAGSISFKGTVEYFFDETPDSDDDLPGDAYDFISLATHELGHVLGFTPCEAFRAQLESDSFSGKAATSEYGGAVPLTSDGLHLADGTTSRGVEALMTPTLPSGARRAPTPLDTAILHDLGYALED